MEGIRSGGAQGQAWTQMLKFLDTHLNQGSIGGTTSPTTSFLPDFDWRYYFTLTYEHAFGTASHMH
jgi:hypothetical protein